MSTEILVNERIRAKTVRLIDGEQVLGVLPFHEAMNRARIRGLDLVLVAPGDVPVVRILDADRYRFQRKKAEKEQARRQRELTVETKEVQLRPVTDDADITIKARKARGFLEEGDKVKVIVRFRGRERSHKEQGREVIERFLAEVGEHKVDKPLAVGESDITIILAPVRSKAELHRAREAKRAS